MLSLLEIGDRGAAALDRTPWGAIAVRGWTPDWTRPISPTRAVAAAQPPPTHFSASPPSPRRFLGLLGFYHGAGGLATCFCPNKGHKKRWKDGRKGARRKKREEVWPSWLPGPRAVALVATLPCSPPLLSVPKHPPHTPRHAQGARAVPRPPARSVALAVLARPTMQQAVGGRISLSSVPRAGLCQKPPRTPQGTRPPSSGCAGLPPCLPAPFSSAIHPSISTPPPSFIWRSHSPKRTSKRQAGPPQDPPPHKHNGLLRVAGVQLRQWVLQPVLWRGAVHATGHHGAQGE